MAERTLSPRVSLGFAAIMSLAAALLGETAAAQPLVQSCRGDAGIAFPAPRVVEIDAAGGPIFGAFTKQVREPAFLKPKEVLLTFDDGPMPWITRSILDTLDQYCARATFFAVGRMALAYPDVVRDIAARGHTLASHTMTHPFNMPRMSASKAQDEIERGFAAVSAAAGGPIAPFFRFPGLADSSALLDYLQQRGIAAFTVDVVSNDSYIASPSRLAERTLAEIDRANGGIVLFHDIKRATAKALPEILKALKARGYTIVHLTATTPVAPNVELFADYSAKIAASKKDAGTGATLVPFYGAVGPVAATANVDSEPITRLAPAPRPRVKAAISPHIANSDGTATSVSPLKPDAPSHRKSPSNGRPAHANH